MNTVHFTPVVETVESVVSDTIDYQIIMEKLEDMHIAADAYGLGAEVMAAFVRALVPNLTEDQMDAAIWQAESEWDI